MTLQDVHSITNIPVGDILDHLGLPEKTDLRCPLLILLKNQDRSIQEGA